MSRYRGQVAAALRAVTIRGDTAYGWLGRKSRPLPASLRAVLDVPERRSYLVGSLREELYWSFYCQGRPVAARWGEPEPVAADPWLATALSEANTGRGSWEPGWKVERLQGDEAVVATPRLRARLPTSDCTTLAGAVRPGAAVSVRVPKELPALSPGFYTAVGEAVVEHLPSEAIVRVYWNVTRAVAPTLVRALTSTLDAEQVPFRLKVADHPLRLQRCDAAVLYVPSEAFAVLRKTLSRLAGALTWGLRPEIPAFTLELVPGVGLAEDDGAGESFGARRCALLADGIVRVHEHAIPEGSAQVDAVAARFAEDGVRIDAPYLEPSLTRHVL